jgi:hypothetical protein
MSQVLNQRVFACGHQAVTIGGAATGGAVNVSMVGVKKATDTILVSLDINGDTDVAVTLTPYVYSVTDNTAFIVDLDGVANNGVDDVIVFLNWAVLR